MSGIHGLRNSLSGRARWFEIAIVLGLGLGQSAVYSIVAIIAKLSSGTPLANQSTTVVPSLADRAWLDALYQVPGNVFPLFVVALALYLLWLDGSNPFRRIGLDWQQPTRDLCRAGMLVLAVGVPGLGVYVLGRLLGLTVAVQVSSVSSWWMVGILLLVSLRAALEEEVVVIGYLFTRLAELGWRRWQMILGSALLRGSYHLYQGIGPFVGNVAMGLIFGWLYTRWGRVMPLVIAHFLFDAIQFLGYPVALALWPSIFAAT